MKVNILFQDKSIMQIENVKRVTNASTELKKDDWLYIYCNGDIAGFPSKRYRMCSIVCVEVKEK